MTDVVFVYPGHGCPSSYFDLAWLKLVFANRYSRTGWDDFFLLGDEAPCQYKRDSQQTCQCHHSDILPKSDRLSPILPFYSYLRKLAAIRISWSEQFRKTMSPMES